MTSTSFDLPRSGRPGPAHQHTPVRHSGIAIRTVPASAVAPSHAATLRHWPQAGAGLERITPRPDSTGACERCGHGVVFDEVAGWVHTGRTSPPPPAGYRLEQHTARPLDTDLTPRTCRRP